MLLSCTTTTTLKSSNFSTALDDNEDQEEINSILQDLSLNEEYQSKNANNRNKSSKIFRSSVITPSKNQIPIEINSKVKKWIRYFTKKRPELFERYMFRGKRYKNLINKVLAKKDLPSDLYYLALVESGFRISAKSHAGAVGPWQFIRSRAKIYHLKVTSEIDERQNPFKATEAASEYLRDLYNTFGSWYLAMAAYNCGEACVRRAIFKTNTRDYWELCRKKRLPRETREYVAKILAAIIIGKNPERYGLSIARNMEIGFSHKVFVPGGVSLSRIAKVGKINFGELKKFNTDLIRGRTPSYTKKYAIRFPSKRGISRSQFNQLNKFRYKRSKSATKHRKSYGNTYRIRRGDSLYSIARRHSLSVRYLKSINNIRGNKIFPGQRLKITKGKSVAKNAKKARRYKVRRGDTLWTISRKFNTSIKKIKRNNKLSKNNIKIGQRLLIY